jgi:hypothetical protein
MLKRITKEVNSLSTLISVAYFVRASRAWGVFTPGALKPSGLGAIGPKARYMDFIESLIDIDIAHDREVDYT